MVLCARITKPANAFWKYQKEKEMQGFYGNLLAKVKSEYIFPITLNKIDTKPQIFNVFPQGVQEGFFPTIEYLTNIDLKNTGETQKENDLIHAAIGQIFPGIDIDKQYIFYKAYNEMPDGKTPVPTYGFVKELQ